MYILGRFKVYSLNMDRGKIPRTILNDQWWKHLLHLTVVPYWMKVWVVARIRDPFNPYCKL